MAPKEHCVLIANEKPVESIALTVRAGNITISLSAENFEEIISQFTKLTKNEPIPF